MVVTRSQSLKNEYFKKNTKESINMVNKENTNSDMATFLLRDNIPASDSELSDNDKNKNKKVIKKKSKDILKKLTGKKKEKKNKEIKPRISIDMSNVFQKLIKRKSKKVKDEKNNKDLKKNKDENESKKEENRKSEKNEELEDEELENDEEEVDGDDINVDIDIDVDLQSQEIVDIVKEHQDTDGSTGSTKPVETNVN